MQRLLCPDRSRRYEGRGSGGVGRTTQPPTTAAWVLRCTVSSVTRRATSVSPARRRGAHHTLARPLGSDLAARLVQALGGSLREVRIDRLVEGTYYAVIVVDGPQGTAEVDARPSDALALALVVGTPVRADRAVVEVTGSSKTVAEALAVIDSQAAAGPGAFLDELAEQARHQDPSEPAT